MERTCSLRKSPLGFTQTRAGFGTVHMNRQPVVAAGGVPLSSCTSLQSPAATLVAAQAVPHAAQAAVGNQHRSLHAVNACDAQRKQLHPGVRYLDLPQQTRARGQWPGRTGVLGQGTAKGTVCCSSFT